MWDKEGLTAKANRYLIAGCITFLVIMLALVMCGCDGDSGGTGGVFPTNGVLDSDDNDPTCPDGQDCEFNQRPGDGGGGPIDDESSDDDSSDDESDDG